MMTKRVLIVDDEPAALFSMHAFLSENGFAVEYAQEPEEAEALLSNLPFDILITDLALTPLQQAEGLNVIGFIRERSMDVRVIVLSAEVTPEIALAARELGVDAFIEKPAPLGFIAMTIRKLLGDES